MVLKDSCLEERFQSGFALAPKEVLEENLQPLLTSLSPPGAPPTLPGQHGSAARYHQPFTSCILGSVSSGQVQKNSPF